MLLDAARLDALKRYPKDAGEDLILRPMVTDDRSALVSFFRRIPAEERRLFKDDVRDPWVIDRWIRELDYLKVLPLVVTQGYRIVADATLHRDRRGWARHVARIRLSVDPDFRALDLSRLLIKEFIELAPELEVAILDAEVLTDQKEAIRIYESLGFQCIAALPHHAFDFTDRLHDVAIYSYAVTSPEKMMKGAARSEEDSDIGGGQIFAPS